MKSTAQARFKVSGLRARLKHDEAEDTEVYQLSAQFPGPTTPRDFVTLLITSSSALSISDPEKSLPFSDRPKHFMVVSKPCLHPECPSRDGFIRGQYESVEFIRELPRRPKRSSSASDLLKGGSEGLNRRPASAATSEATAEGRKRGKTISFAELREAQMKGEATDTSHDESDDESNPVEWIMITRSDPGGSVPRFMVERGTPASIVADAGKFVEWACKKDHSATEPGPERTEDVSPEAKDLEAPQTNGHLAGLETMAEETSPKKSEEGDPTIQPPKALAGSQDGLLADIANATKARVEAYTPQALFDRWHGIQQAQPSTTEDPSVRDEERDVDELSTTASDMSFASAEERFDDSLSTKSFSSRVGSSKNPDAPQPSRHENELMKLSERKKALDEKFNKSREKEVKDKELLTSKEQERLRKAEEKHKREIAKYEERYKKEIAKLEAKRVKEASKEEDRRKKEQDKDEKARLTRERDEARQELDVLKQERTILLDQIGALQKENTSLVARLGKMGEGRSVLKEVQAEIVGGSRSRSSSLRSRETDQGKEATILGSEKKDDILK